MGETVNLLEKCHGVFDSRSEKLSWQYVDISTKDRQMQEEIPRNFRTGDQRIFGGFSQLMF